MVKTKLRHVGLDRDKALIIEEARLNLSDYNDSFQKTLNDLDRLKRTLARQTEPEEVAYYKNEIKEARKFLQLYRKRITQERNKINKIII